MVQRIPGGDSRRLLGSAKGAITAILVVALVLAMGVILAPRPPMKPRGSVPLLHLVVAYRSQSR
ncbi:MAG: hypothetical protein ABI034_04700 [Nakamurella sp.]